MKGDYYYIRSITEVNINFFVTATIRQTYYYFN